MFSLSVVRSRLLAAGSLSLVGLILPLQAIAGPAVQADADGVVLYPNQGPTSIGNQTQEIFSSHDDSKTGNAVATSSIDETRSGTDASAGPDITGTSGTTTTIGSSTAALGSLSGSSYVYASSHGNGFVVVYPHGDSQMSVTASFQDTTSVYNADYALGVMIPVEMTLDLDWEGGFSLGTLGGTYGESGAYANLGVAFQGNVSVQTLMRSDLDPSLWDYATPETLSFSVENGGTFDWSASITGYAKTKVDGLEGDETVLTSSAYSDVSMDVMPTSEYAGTIFTSESGLVYPVPAPTAASGVPDETSTIGLIGLTLGGLALAGMNRRQRQALAGARG